MLLLDWHHPKQPFTQQVVKSQLLPIIASMFVCVFLCYPHSSAQVRSLVFLKPLC
jgi:hypothetical protein